MTSTCHPEERSDEGSCPLSLVYQLLIQVLFLTQGELDPVGIALSVCQHQDTGAGFLVMHDDIHPSVREAFHLGSGKGLILHGCAPAAVQLIGLAGKRDICAEELRPLGVPLEKEQCDHRHQAYGAGEKDRLLIREDPEDQNGDDPKAEDGGDQVVRKFMPKGDHIGNALIYKQNQNGGQDQGCEKIVLLHVPADEGCRKCDKGDVEPVAVISEQFPAHLIEGNLEQVHQGLRDQKEYEGLQRRFQWALAVQHDNKGKGNPGFRCDGYVMKRAGSRNPRSHHSCIDSGNDSHNDHLGPGHIQPAEYFMKQLTHSYLLIFMRCHSEENPCHSEERSDEESCR